MPKKTTPAVDRILRNIKIEPGPMPDPCWIWQGGKNNVGYGMIRANTSGPTKMGTVHRVMADSAGMNIVGTNVLHTCRNHACANPAHLFTGTLDQVYAAREADPKNPKFGRKKGEKAPTKQCPHCTRQIPTNVMYRHLACSHKDV